MDHVKKANKNAVVVSKKRHWSAGLLVSMEDPKYIVKEDDIIVAIRDKYPKARFHYLVLPKANISNIWDITKEHENLLLHMDNVAEELCKEHPEHEFIVGYHALPSMQRLHLHVISTDFNSKCLKTKYHWNNFTTPYFMPSKELCKQLNEKGELLKVSNVQARAYLNTELRCHKCMVKPKNMSQLKKHLLSHLS